MMGRLQGLVRRLMRTRSSTSESMLSFITGLKIRCNIGRPTKLESANWVIPLGLRIQPKVISKLSGFAVYETLFPARKSIEAPKITQRYHRYMGALSTEFLRPP